MQPIGLQAIGLQPIGLQTIAPAPEPTAKLCSLEEVKEAEEVVEVEEVEETGGGLSWCAPPPCPPCGFFSRLG
tara:strand:- start:394 stop:612 length:219 start_codon:yes stop_codon:yes gene_type:complete